MVSSYLLLSEQWQQKLSYEVQNRCGIRAVSALNLYLSGEASRLVLPKEDIRTIKEIAREQKIELLIHET